MEQTGKVIGVTEIGPRMTLSGKADMQAVGEAVHGYLAVDATTLDEAAKLEVAQGLLDRWEAADNVVAAEVVAAGESLKAWADDAFPGATWRRELDLQQRLETGTVVRGAADLVLETASGAIVIDHKSFPGSKEQATDKAGGLRGNWKPTRRCWETGRSLPGCSFICRLRGWWWKWRQTRCLQ